MYRAFKDLGIPTELYLASREEHNFLKPSNQLFLINRELEWFAEHLGTSYTASLPNEANEGAAQ